MKYKVLGSGRNVIFLHGWGCSKEIFDKLAMSLADQYKVWTIDLPGFGESEEPHVIYSIEDYSKRLEEFIKLNNIEEPILVGHSFGGRVAIKYASKHYVNKMILISSAGVRKISFKSMNYKIKKRFLTLTGQKSKIAKLREKFASSDYKKASPVMQEIMKKSLRENQISDMKRITCETLLLWGVNDTATPVSMAKKMNSKIRHSGLVTLDNCSHFPFIEKFDNTLLIIKSFLKED